MNRAELMAEIDRRWRMIDDLVKESSYDDLAAVAGGPEAPPDGWTVGEVLIHMAGWKRRALDIAYLLTAKPDAPDSEVNDRLFSEWESWNAGHRDRAKGIGPDDILSEHHAAHRALIQAISALPDECLLAGGKDRRWLRPLMAHTFDHLDSDLKPVLQR